MVWGGPSGFRILKIKNGTLSHCSSFGSWGRVYSSAETRKVMGTSMFWDPFGALNFLEGIREYIECF